MNASGIQTLPPHDLGAESAVLGAALLSSGALDDVMAISLQPEDFYQPTHGHVWAAIKDLVGSGEPVDAVTVSARLDRAGLLDAIGGAGRLLDFQASTPSLGNASHYASTVRDDAQTRRMLNGLRAIAEDLVDNRGREGREQARLRAETMFWDLTRGDGTDPDRTVAEVMAEAVVKLEEDAPPAIASGLHDYDTLLGGFRPGTLNTLAARTAVGKSALAAGMAFEAARNGAKVAFFSLEMDDTDLAMRELASKTGVNGTHFRDRNLNETHWIEVFKVLPDFAEMPMTINDRAQSLDALRSSCRRVQSRLDGLDLVVLDYVQLLDSGLRPDVPQHLKVGHITRSLKMMAREMGCAVLALAQVNRGVEHRADKRPTLSDLKDSGSIEQDSDTVTFAYRDEIYNPDSADAGIAELHVAKNRGGRTGTVKVIFLPQYTKFVSLAKRT